MPSAIWKKPMLYCCWLRISRLDVLVKIYEPRFTFTKKKKEAKRKFCEYDYFFFIFASGLALLGKIVVHILPNLLGRWPLLLWYGPKANAPHNSACLNSEMQHFPFMMSLFCLTTFYTNSLFSMPQTLYLAKLYISSFFEYM